VVFILHDVLTSKLQLAHAQHYTGSSANNKVPNVETGKRRMLPYMHVYLSNTRSRWIQTSFSRPIQTSFPDSNLWMKKTKRTYSLLHYALSFCL